MGMNEISIWLLIRRCDKFDSEIESFEPSLKCFSVSASLTLEELKQQIYSWIGIENDGSKVFKLRRHDEHLIPLSDLLQGSHKDKIKNVCARSNVEQGPVAKRTIPLGYVDALKLKLDQLEKRVLLAETCVPRMTDTHIYCMEMTASQLTDCVNFLDRRLDELVPKQWKTKTGSDDVY